ncbi:MAG: hypothetical protein IJF22_01695 [Clostridia bacterium]|nr:hypothetical protein [Clostridia bacterium]
MKKSLWDYASSKPQNPKTNPQTEEKQPQPPNNLEEQIKHYQSMPREDLLATFYQEVAKQKQNGTFDLKKLESTLSSLDAFLSPEQKKNIKELLNQI